MIAARAALRQTRPLRLQLVRRPNSSQRPRFQSTSRQGPGDANAKSFHPALTGGVAGAVTATGLFYLYYHLSGTRQVVKASKQTKAYIDSVQQKFKEKTPEPNEALRWLRQTATYYSGFIPGARSYVEIAFDDLDKIREKHGDEVDDIVREAWEELQEKAKDGNADLGTAKQAWEILYRHLQRILQLAGDAAEEIMNNHPQLKQTVGGNVDQLKSMGEKLGPEAKKQVDETWNQVRDIVNEGINTESIDKIRQLVEDKMQAVKKLGDEAWKKALEQAKPYLDRNPEVKQIVEQNAQALKQGNFQELVSRIRQAVESGDTEELKKYISSATEKAKGSGMGTLQKYLDSIPGGTEILPKLSQLQEIAQAEGQEAQKLVTETVNEVSKVLSRKSEEAKKIAERARRESK